MAKRKGPVRLYKYLAFRNRKPDALIADQIFSADPSTFNDPLDTKPTLCALLPFLPAAERVGSPSTSLMPQVRN